MNITLITIASLTLCFFLFLSPKRKHITSSFEKFYVMMLKKLHQGDTAVYSNKDNQYVVNLISSLKEENQHLRHQIAVLEKRTALLVQENASLSKEIEASFLYQHELHDEYQATFQEQSSMLEKRQAYIGKLEIKIQDLMDEMKNLLTFDHAHISKQIKPWIKPSSKNFSLQLLNSLKQIAFKIENSRQNLSLSKNEDLVVQNYSLEYRQIFESLRNENLGMLFVYSLYMKRLIFSHQLFKDWTGYHGEDFFKIKEKIVLSNTSWLSEENFASQGYSCGQIVIQTRQSGNIPFHYSIIMLNKGLFNNHLLGVLHPNVTDAIVN